MELARRIGLPVPRVALVRTGRRPALLVERYDRLTGEDGVTRLHQEDFCQALRVSRTRKYEEDGGPGHARCASLLGSERERRLWLSCAVFNCLIGNTDAHAKNFSLLYQEDGQAVLAPFYDLVSTMAWPELSRKFSMGVGKTFRYERIRLHSWVQLAQDMRVGPDCLFAVMREVMEAVSAHFEPLAAEHAERHGPSPVYGSIMQVVRNGLRNLSAVLDRHRAEAE